ncbi:uncharacterized protein [Branchiostoma lanceolatum]|uniref:uncharacterized protein n=1 Tax=Branchiostoma lanceolatum TaxID=7740 RepID=UPI0034566E49
MGLQFGVRIFPVAIDEELEYLAIPPSLESLWSSSRAMKCCWLPPLAFSRTVLSSPILLVSVDELTSVVIVFPSGEAANCRLISGKSSSLSQGCSLQLPQDLLHS